MASVRNPLHVLDSALMGAHVATIPFNVLQQLSKHPLTDIGGIDRFRRTGKRCRKAEAVCCSIVRPLAAQRRLLAQAASKQSMITHIVLFKLKDLEP